MHHLSRLSLIGTVGALFALGLVGASAVVACDEDDNIVRTRTDGSADGDADGDAEGGSNTLACGVAIPATYDSPSFAVNAAAELGLKTALGALTAKMASAEGAAGTPVTTADLQAIFTGGAPSLRSIATAFGQSTVDQYLTQFGEAAPRTWTPESAEADGGVSSGGKYAGVSIVSASGVDLRAATDKVLFNGALYSYALVLASGPITEATIDRLLAIYGGTTQLGGRTDAGASSDALMAAFAAQRDNEAAAAPGPYRKIRSSLLVARAAASNTEKCRKDLDAALKTYFLEWEKASYLTVIYFLNQASTSATILPATPATGQAALQAYGAALGLAQSFKGIPQDRRKITDAQIDALLTRIGATSAYQLVTHPSERAVAFNTAYQDVGSVYGLTQTEIEDAKKSY